MSIFLLWTWSKLKKFVFLKNWYPLYFIADGIFSVTGGGDDRVCFIYIYNAVIWSAFCGVILCYWLTNLYLSVEISVSMIACIILMLQYHMATLLFSRWWEGAGDWYVFIGRLLLIDLNNRWPIKIVNQIKIEKLNWMKELQIFGTWWIKRIEWESLRNYWPSPNRMTQF